MDDNKDKEIAHLTAVSSRFGQQLRTAKCEKSAAIIYVLQFSLMKTFEYPMVMTQLDEATWCKILHATLAPALHKASMSMSFPRDVLFGPDLFQGFQLQHPFFSQEISHITTLLQESARNSQTGKLLRLTAECLRLELGIPLTIGQTPYEPFEAYVTPCWYKLVWKFGAEHPLQIHKDLPNVQLLREGDQFLMQTFVSGGFRGQELSWLNTMPMAIKTISLTDIVTADRGAITQQAYLLKHANGLRDNFDWPRAPPGAWSYEFEMLLWRRALKQCFLATYGVQHSRVLLPQHRLRSWK